MDTWLIVLLVVVGVLGVAFLFVGVPAITLRMVARSLRPRIAAAIPPGQIVLQDLRAVTFGLQSKGVFQNRGNGALVLTPEALWFFMAVTHRDLKIPLDKITGIKTVRSHLGKTYFRDLLHVSFEAPDGPEAVAWYVADVPAWQAKIRELRGG